MQARRQGVGVGGAMGVNAPTTGQKGPPGRIQRRTYENKKNAKDESFLLICQPMQLFTV